MLSGLPTWVMSLIKANPGTPTSAIRIEIIFDECRTRNLLYLAVCTYPVKVLFHLKGFDRN